MKPRHLLAYVVEHPNGLFTAKLLRRWRSQPPLVAWGDSLAAVEKDLLDQIGRLRSEPGQDLAPWLWQDEPRLEHFRLEVHPQTQVGQVQMVGERTAPVRLAYALTPNAEGHLLLVPRFDWVLEVESPALGTTMIRQYWYALLAGAEGSELLSVPPLGEERLVAWRLPGRLASPQAQTNTGWENDSFGFAETQKVAENWAVRSRAAGPALPLLDLFDQERHHALFDRPQPASLLVVGPPGVGKTAWIQLLAARQAQRDRELVEGEPPAFWASSADRILAGMAYLGQWEERCLRLIQELQHEGQYLYLGHLGPLAEKRGHSAILELFAEPLAEQSLSLIVEASPEELERCERLVPTVLRHFRRIRLDPIPTSQMPQLLLRYAERRQFPRLSATSSAMACHLLDAFQRHRAFPGKSLQFFEDWRSHLLEHSPGSSLDHLPPLTARQVVERFSETTGLPAELVAPRQATTLAQLEQKLATGVVGQPAACAAVARVLARFRAGLYHPEKPLGSLLLVGQTGVGKTELAKQLARVLFGDEKRLLRYDMSEYHLPGAARRLLAVGAGTQSLAQNLRQQPLAVILFDEIEKAHPEVLDLLLGALGEGRLTDSDGLWVDLRMTVILLTSNLGVRRAARPGFGSNAASPGEPGDFLEAVRRFFRPELVNRLDEIVPFRALDLAEIEKIVDLQFEKIRRRPGFTRRGIRLFLEPGARNLLARQGFDPRYGARPLLRLLEEKVLGPLSTLLAEDPTCRDRKIFITDHPPATTPPGSQTLVLAP